MEAVVSDVSQCNVNDCVFNMDQKCHTMAIMVGGPDPLCDTFMTGKSKGGNVEFLAKIGACKVDDCSFNVGYECEARSVSVKMNNEKAMCGTCKMDI